MTLAEAGVGPPPSTPCTSPPTCSARTSARPGGSWSSAAVEAPDGYADLVAERADRVPLQHLTGRAYFRGLALAVGPGGLRAAPRDRAARRPRRRARPGPALDGRGRPVVVDLGTGSGRDRARRQGRAGRHGVRGRAVTDLAYAWAVRNRDRLGLDVDLRPRRRDDTHTPRLDGAVDVVMQPAVHPRRPGARRPRGARPRPREALYGGSDDGLALPLAVAPGRRAAARRRHCSSWSTPTPRATRCRGPCAGTGDWDKVIDHVDLLGRPRCVVATRHRVRGRDERGTCMSEVFDCTNARGAWRQGSRPPPGPSSRSGGRAPDGHRLRDRVRCVRRVGRDRRARRQGPWSRHAAARARPNAAHRSTAWRRSVPPYVRHLIDRFWPGALTLVLESQPSLTWDLGETNGTVALRMPDHEIALALLGQAGPMAVTAPTSPAGRRPRPSRRPRNSSAPRSRSTSTVVPLRAGSPRRSSTAPATRRSPCAKGR